MLQAFELCRARFLETLQPLNRIVFQPGADRIRKPRRFEAGLQPGGAITCRGANGTSHSQQQQHSDRPPHQRCSLGLLAATDRSSYKLHYNSR
jgi:hypothetical protein